MARHQWGRGLGAAEGARRASLAPTAAAALLAGLVCMAATASARAGWSRPVRLAGPYSLDVLPAQVAFAPNGRGAVAFGLQNEDHPATEESFIVLRSASGRLAKARRVPARQILALAFTRGTLDLLTGKSAPGTVCCSSADLMGVSAKGFGGAKRIVGNLTGAAIGGLVVREGQRLLAAVATAGGVWVSQRAPRRRFGAARLLSGSGSVPQTLAAANVARGRTVVGWTAAFGQPPLAPAGAIFEATGTRGRAPRRAREAYIAPTGHQIDELTLGGKRTAWIESWLDAQGIYHSEPMLANLSGKARPVSFPVAGQTASGLSFAANGSGDQVLAWKACSAAGACTVRAAVKDAGPHKRFGAPLDLGPIDPSQTPAAALSKGGQAVVAWVSHGHVLSGTRRRRARGFGRPRRVSATSLASDVTVAFGPGSSALAVWTQGTVASSVMGATFSAR